MNENQHHKAALDRLRAAGENPGSYVDPDTRNLLAASTEATLALAYEQRTANLIALFGKTHPNGAGAFPNDKLDAAQIALMERLGL